MRLAGSAMMKGQKFHMNKFNGWYYVNDVCIKINNDDEVIMCKYSGHMILTNIPNYLFRRWIPHGNGEINFTDKGYFNGCFSYGRFFGQGEFRTSQYLYKGNWDCLQNGYGKEYIYR